MLTGDSDKNGFFKNLAPGEVLKKEELQKKLVEGVNRLIKFNVWCEAAVEYSETGYLIVRDTSLIDF